MLALYGAPLCPTGMSGRTEGALSRATVPLTLPECPEALRRNQGPQLISPAGKTLRAQPLLRRVCTTFRILVYEDTDIHTGGFLLAMLTPRENRLRGLAEGFMQRPLTVAEQVANVLRESIADGSLAAGTPLRQDDLAERFGFSRMPVRDALRQLEAEGIVSIHPTKGAHVARMDAAEIREIFAVRALLEGEALRLSVPKLGNEKLDEAGYVLNQIDAEPLGIAEPCLSPGALQRLRQRPAARPDRSPPQCGRPLRSRSLVQP